MKSPRLLLLASAALALLATSCGQTAVPADDSSVEPVNLAGTHWLLAELDGAAPVDGTIVTAQFGSDQTVAGSGGCNQYTGRFTVEGNTISVDENLATTMMACEDAIMAQETAYLGALVGANTVALSDDELTLEGERGTLRFAVQSQELAGTSWKVLAYNNGASAVVSILDGSEPTLEFTADQTLAGTGGCNRLTGQYGATDGTLEVGPVASTMMACDEPEGVMEQEAAIVAALESATRYVVSGDTLTLRTAEDQIALQLARS